MLVVGQKPQQHFNAIERQPFTGVIICRTSCGVKPIALRILAPSAKSISLGYDDPTEDGRANALS
jgi:hypothetical protein